VQLISFVIVVQGGSEKLIFKQKIVLLSTQWYQHKTYFKHSRRNPLVCEVISQTALITHSTFQNNCIFLECLKVSKKFSSKELSNQHDLYLTDKRCPLIKRVDTNIKKGKCIKLKKNKIKKLTLLNYYIFTHT